LLLKQEGGPMFSVDLSTRDATAMSSSSYAGRLTWQTPQVRRPRSG